MNEKEKPQQDTEVFVKGVKRQTRKKFTAEEKIRIVLEGLRGEDSIAELCQFSGEQPGVPAVSPSLRGRPESFDEEADYPGVRHMFGHALVAEVVQVKIIAR